MEGVLESQLLKWSGVIVSTGEVLRELLVDGIKAES